MPSFRQSQIEGVVTISLSPIGDERGKFMRRFCANEFREAGLPSQFVQINQSRTTEKGTVRGMHYQAAPALEGKLVGCTHGRIFDVAVDLRAGSPTFLQWVGFELHETAMLYIPEGCAHGFQTLTDDVSMIYMHTAFYSPDHEGGVRFDDPAIGIDWPLPVGTMSARDQSFNPLQHDFRGLET